MNIYRQDSTFANVKFRPALYFHLSSKQKIGAREILNFFGLDDTYTSGQDFSKKELELLQFTETSEEPLLFTKPKLLARQIYSVLFIKI